MPTLTTTPGKRTYELLKKGTRVKSLRDNTIVGRPRGRVIRENWEGTVQADTTAAYADICWDKLEGQMISVQRDTIEIVQSDA